MTVPALGCPGVSRWDLTRHGLTSLPYSPSTGGRVGKGAMRGGESLAVDFLCFIQTFVKTKMDRPLSNTEPTLFYSTAQKIIFLKHFTFLFFKSQMLNVFFKKSFFSNIYY